jgi:lysophospholipase L1-like esterase
LTTTENPPLDRFLSNNKNTRERTIMSFSTLTRRGLLAAVCVAPLAAHAPAVFAQETDKRPALFLIGDSIIRNGTADNGSTNGQWGWGHILPYFFDTTRIHVVNDAMGGTSSRSFMESPTLWPRVKQMIRPGDFVLMGFGHNDSRGSMPGNGDETGFLPPAPPRQPRPAPAAANGAVPAAPPPPPRPAPEPVAVHSFGWYMRKYIQEVRALGATPIVMSLIPRNRWVDGKIGTDGKDYAVWAKQAADQEKAQFIPLYDLVEARLNAIGQEKVVAEYFPPNEAVHPTWIGATLNASQVVEGIKRLDTPLKQYLLASPQVPATADIPTTQRGFPGASAMAPTTRTPTPLAGS